MSAYQYVTPDERVGLNLIAALEQKEVCKITRFLANHGIDSRRAVQIYRVYGRDSIAKIKENPYQLAYDVRGIGPKTADDMAAKLGIDRDIPAVFNGSAGTRR